MSWSLYYNKGVFHEFSESMNKSRQIFLSFSDPRGLVSAWPNNAILKLESIPHHFTAFSIRNDNTGPSITLHCLDYVSYWTIKTSQYFLRAKNSSTLVELLLLFLGFEKPLMEWRVVLSHSLQVSNGHFSRRYSCTCFSPESLGEVGQAVFMNVTVT